MGNFEISIAGFNTYATFGLFHGGYSYCRNGQVGENIDWKCSTSKQTGCKGRATTRVIDGFAMLKFDTAHSHPPEHCQIENGENGTN